MLPPTSSFSTTFKLHSPTTPPPIPPQQQQQQPQNQPLHRQPISRSARISLLDLPDEALTQILTAITPAGPVRRHDIEFGPDSCDLAIACPRLLHLFRTQALTTLDALYPESYTQAPPRAPDGLLTSHHLAALVRLAGNVLHTLRLPFDNISPHHALWELAIRRIRLQHLVYRNLPPVPEYVESELFAHAASDIRILTIHHPTTVLTYIPNATRLEQLELTGIPPHLVSEFAVLLPKLPPTLRVLRVAFDACDSHHALAITHGVPVSVWCLTTFADYLCASISDHLSMLHVLDVSAEPSPIIHHDHRADNQENELHPIANNFGDSILRLREFNLPVLAVPQLRHLALRCTSAPLLSNMSTCIQAFSKLITPNLTVELQAVSFTIVFPHDDTPPYFKALQMTLEEVHVYENHIDFDYSGLETLDLGSNRFVTVYSAEEAIRRTVMDIVWQATDVLSTLIVEAEVMTSVMMENVCRYIGDVLEIAPYVHTISMRAEVVDFVDKGCADFQRMMMLMSKVKVLRLTTLRQNGADCKLAFGRHFPVFLNAVARSCPNLECLFLEPALPVRPESIPSSEIFKLAMKSHRLCIDAVENLEAVLPKCDVTSVRSQLNVWYKDLSALSLLKSFCV